MLQLMFGHGLSAFRWSFKTLQKLLLPVIDYFVVVLLRQFAWKTEGLGCLQSDLCDDDELM